MSAAFFSFELNGVTFVFIAFIALARADLERRVGPPAEDHQNR
jgi:hypothetical protein